MLQRHAQTCISVLYLARLFCPSGCIVHTLALLPMLRPVVTTIPDILDVNTPSPILLSPLPPCIYLLSWDGRACMHACVMCVWRRFSCGTYIYTCIYMHICVCIYVCTYVHSRLSLKHFLSIYIYCVSFFVAVAYLTHPLFFGAIYISISFLYI